MPNKIEFYEDFDLDILKASIMEENMNIEIEMTFRHIVDQLKESIIELPLEVDSVSKNICIGGDKNYVVILYRKDISK
jgi:hypothetical protein